MTVDQILENIGKIRIAVIGDVCLDVYWTADMKKSVLSRETPHHPLPVVEEKMSPGGAANVIMNALALKPEILCFDEPTSALDPELTGEVLRVIRGLRDRGYTMIVVTHEMEFARGVADHVIYMADGVIEEEGAPEEVFSSPKSEKTKAFLAHAFDRTGNI